MSDLLFDFFDDEYQLDLVLNNSEIQTDESLRMPVLVSLFTDARCEKNEIPKGQTSQKGFWGDAILGEKTGSKLWLLDKSKLNNETLIKYKEYAQDALKWMITDGIAKEIKITSEYNLKNELILLIQIKKPSGEIESITINDLWKHTI